VTPATAAAMRAALEARIVSQAANGGLDAGRLRRRLVFQRVVRRLDGDDRWVLKGGYLLEARLAAGARTTRDLDLASGVANDLDGLRDAFDEALTRDPDGDFFRFTTTKNTRLDVDQAGQGGWRFSVQASMAGRIFDQVRVDIVERVTETDDGTEVIELASPITGVSFTPARVFAVDVAQHAAEKFHALCRIYSADRPNTRVKDLVDVVLLAEAGLLPDQRLGDRLRVVFASRDHLDPPPTLPTPPSSWERDYLSLVVELPVTTDSVGAAMEVAQQLYRQALA